MREFTNYDDIDCHGPDPKGLTGRCYHGNGTTPVTRIARYVTGEWVSLCDACWGGEHDWYDGRPHLGPASIPVAGPTWMTLYFDEVCVEQVSGWVWVDRYSDHVTVAYEPSGSHDHVAPEIPSEITTIPLDQLVGAPTVSKTFEVTVEFTGDLTGDMVRDTIADELGARTGIDPVDVKVVF